MALLLIVVLSAALPACIPDEPEPVPEAPAQPTETDDSSQQPPADPDIGTPTPVEPVGMASIGLGVTEEACPEAVNPENGCIRLGALIDLTATPQAAEHIGMVQGMTAFWDRVNERGGVSGFDVDVRSHLRDLQGDPTTRPGLYAEMSQQVLALGLAGPPISSGFLTQLAADDMLVVPTATVSSWLFTHQVLESGSPNCLSAVNGLDWWEDRGPAISSVIAIHSSDAPGLDGAAGARRWGQRNEVEVTDVRLPPGGGEVASVVDQLTVGAQDVVLLDAQAQEAGAIVQELGVRDLPVRVVMAARSHRPALLSGGGLGPLRDRTVVAGPVEPHGADTPGHMALREAIGQPPAPGHVEGWLASYPLLALLQQAVQAGDLSRDGLRAVRSSVVEVDYEGMLPQGAGNVAGSGNAAVVRATALSRPTNGADGLESLGFHTGETARGLDLSEPC